MHEAYAATSTAARPSRQSETQRGPHSDIGADPTGRSSMGASLSTGGEPAEEEGVTVVSTGTPRAPQTQADEDSLHQLAALKHVRVEGDVGKCLHRTAATAACSRRRRPASCDAVRPCPLHLQSLPLIPESILEPGSLCSRGLQRLPPTSSSSECRRWGGSVVVFAGNQSRSRSSPHLHRMPAAGKHLDGDLLQQMIADYQRYTQHHSSKVARRQLGLNAAIPKLEQQAVQLQQQLAGDVKGAAAAAANFGAAEGVRQELEALAARLSRLQHRLHLVLGHQ